MPYYSEHTTVLRAELGEALPRDLLRQFHAKLAWRHLLVGARQFAILALATWGLVRFEHPAIWIPLAFAQGFTVFNFTVLLHEVLHRLVFERPRPVAERVGLLYAIPSGISASQFTRWHLDHHAELGSDTGDPPICRPSATLAGSSFSTATPALFPIYFRAARRETAIYPAGLQATIAIERWVSIGAHLMVLGLLWWTFGGSAALRAYVVPVFFVFPIAFTLNRLGQHYDIVPGDPARWSTLVRGHRFWNFWFLNSNFHLEHHYFPGIPFYYLPRLQQALAPFYQRHAIPPRGYGQLVKGWIVDNHAPHSNWDLA